MSRLTKKELDHYRNCPATGYHTDGYIAVDVISSFEYYLVMKDCSGKFHKLIIYFTDNPYVNYKGRRLRLDDFLSFS
uniref:Uncharacterized protein n=1 Tax=Siphoviridae sp. ctrpg19 TaxID=2826481 RepID=A0A8S5MKZ6_9CAUD|nr:MAG TPA: hypothetical protein [Siphoviridae sp. ctrpg19]